MPRHRLADMKNNVNSYFRSCEKDQLPDVWKFCQVVYQCHITSKNLRRLHSCGLKPQAHRHRNRGRLGPPHFLQSGTRLAPSLFSGRELAFTFAICYRHSFCLSFVCDVGAPYSGGWNFPQFFSPYDNPARDSCQKSLVGDAPSPLNLGWKWPTPFLAQRFRPISAHSALTVIANENHSISTYRKSTTRFPTSHRWTVYVTPKSPKGWHKNEISLFVPVKFNFSRKNVCYKVSLCETSSGKVVAIHHSPIQRSIDRLRATSPSTWNWRSKWRTLQKTPILKAFV